LPKAHFGCTPDNSELSDIRPRVHRCEAGGLKSGVRSVFHPATCIAEPPTKGGDHGKGILGGTVPKDWTTERYNAVKKLRVSADKNNSSIHLMDGGLSDNTRARAVLDAIDRGVIRTRINQGGHQAPGGDCGQRSYPKRRSPQP
jgi:hypothetical protein